MFELPQMAVLCTRNDLGTGSDRAALSGIFTVLALPKEMRRLRKEFSLSI